MLSLFPRGVLDEILNLIESVSEVYSSYSSPKEKMEEMLPCVPIHFNGFRAWRLTENLMVTNKFSYIIVFNILIVYRTLIQLVPSCPK